MNLKHDVGNVSQWQIFLLSFWKKSSNRACCKKTCLGVLWMLRYRSACTLILYDKNHQPFFYRKPTGHSSFMWTGEVLVRVNAQAYLGLCLLTWQFSCDTGPIISAHHVSVDFMQFDWSAASLITWSRNFGIVHKPFYSTTLYNIFGWIKNA